MCLAVPMRLIEIEGNNGIAELSGVKKKVNLKLLDEVQLGDYVIIHAGFAISKMDEEEAEETLSIWKEMGELSR